MSDCVIDITWSTYCAAEHFVLRPRSSTHWYCLQPARNNTTIQSIQAHKQRTVARRAGRQKNTTNYTARDIPNMPSRVTSLLTSVTVKNKFMYKPWLIHTVENIGA